MAITTQAEPKVYQLRYYGLENEKNTPNDENIWVGLSSDATKSSNLLANYGSAVKIGIQTLPGVKFYLSGNFSNGIIIDHTGVYELDLRNTNTTINKLFFDRASLNRISEVDNASLIVDILCTAGEGTVNS